MSRTARMLAVMIVMALLIPTAASAQNGNGNGKENNGKGQGHQQTETLQEEECFWENGELAGTATFSGTDSLWPPNHKYRDAVAIWQTEDSGDSFMGGYDATHNQFDEEGNEFNGTGNTGDDIVDDLENSGVLMSDDEGQQTVNFQLRAERAGGDKDGRTYSIIGQWTISGSGGSTTCDFAFFVHVPHDQGKRPNGDRSSVDADIDALRLTF